MRFGGTIPPRGDQQMPKFGLFVASREKPEQEFEGEYLTYASQGTCVAVGIVRNDGKGSDHTFAVIRLAEGQCVKEIK